MTDICERCRRTSIMPLFDAIRIAKRDLLTNLCGEKKTHERSAGNLEVNEKERERGIERKREPICAAAAYHALSRFPLSRARY